MDYKDYYAALGLEPAATPDQIKRSYRKLARKYHPDVSREPDAEARFKEVAEAYEVLKDTEKRSAYDALRDELAQRGTGAGPGSRAAPGPGWDTGFEFHGPGAGDGEWGERSDFFNALFGAAAARAGSREQGPARHRGSDHHARVVLELPDLYAGALRSLVLRTPVQDAQGGVRLAERTIELRIPKGTLPGQRLRLAGQGEPGGGDGPAGDLYLEVQLSPHPRYRVSGRDVFFDLPVSPWEAALGAALLTPTPDGTVELKVPAGSAQDRRLRLAGRGLPASPPGDLYAVLKIVLPPAHGPAASRAWRDLAAAFPDFDPRQPSKEQQP